MCAYTTESDPPPSRLATYGVRARRRTGIDLTPAQHYERQTTPLTFLRLY